MPEPGTLWIHATNAPRLNMGDTIEYHAGDGVYPRGRIVEVDAANLRVRVRPLTESEDDDDQN